MVTLIGSRQRVQARPPRSGAAARPSSAQSLLRNEAERQGTPRPRSGRARRGPRATPCRSPLANGPQTLWAGWECTTFRLVASVVFHRITSDELPKASLGETAQQRRGIDNL